MYVASEFFAVMSASRAFSAAVPVAAICASCKPALLCSDGCGATAVRQPRPTDFDPTASWAPAIPIKHQLLHVCERRRACLLLERAH